MMYILVKRHSLGQLHDEVYILLSNYLLEGYDVGVIDNHHYVLLRGNRMAPVLSVVNHFDSHWSTCEVELECGAASMADGVSN